MKLLVIRTSAMGDVALLAPVLKSIEKQYPDTEIVLLTRPAFAPFFYSFSGVKLFLADFRKRYSGFSGIYRIFSDLRKDHKFDYIIDLHGVIRSYILSGLFRLTGVPVVRINKGRREKRNIISGKKKGQLIHTVERYFSVFAQAGYSLKPVDGPWIIASEEAQERALSMLREAGNINIGIAPYAKHHLKMWPESSMIRLMEMIAKNSKVRFWLFGGKEETPKLIALQTRIPESVLVAGTLSLDEELALISRLKFMISMDSSNMHLAALTGTKVISIWGGTDPISGFGPWQQPGEYAIRIPAEELTCRPCTVYGKGKCHRGDFACMMWLTPERVYEKIIEIGLL